MRRVSGGLAATGLICRTTHTIRSRYERVPPKKLLRKQGMLRTETPRPYVYLFLVRSTEVAMHLRKFQESPSKSRRRNQNCLHISRGCRLESASIACSEAYLAASGHTRFRCQRDRMPQHMAIPLSSESNNTVPPHISAFDLFRFNSGCCQFGVACIPRLSWTYTRATTWYTKTKKRLGMEGTPPAINLRGSVLHIGQTGRKRATRVLLV